MLMYMDCSQPSHSTEMFWKITSNIIIFPACLNTAIFENSVHYLLIHWEFGDLGFTYRNCVMLQDHRERRDALLTASGPDQFRTVFHSTFILSKSSFWSTQVYGLWGRGRVVKTVLWGLDELVYMKHSTNRA